MAGQNDIVGSIIGTINGWVQDGDAIWDWIWGNKRAADAQTTLPDTNATNQQQSFFQQYKTPLIIAGIALGGIAAILVIKKIAK